MRFNIRSVISLVLIAAIAGCTDDELLPTQDIPGATDSASPLGFEVKPFISAPDGDDSRAAEPSPTPEPERPEEKQIRDFWLFQFSPDGNTKIAANYYSIPGNDAATDNETKLKQLTKKAYDDLTKDTDMTLYVVANVKDKNWGSEFKTLQEVKDAEMPTAYPIRILADELRADTVFIPMSGQLDNVIVKDKSIIIVPLTRMYAKLKIDASFNNVAGMEVYDLAVANMPYYCKVEEPERHNYDNVPAAMTIPENTEMLTRSFGIDDKVKDTDSDKKWHVIYVPENMQGEVSGVDKKKAGLVGVDEKIPANALKVNIHAKYDVDGKDYYYTVWPGENQTDNFNVRGNHVYRVTIDVNNATDQHNPSSNCFVVKPGKKVTFEPYNRVEKGGGFNISTYLSPDNDATRIDHVDIIWQTKDCIGDLTTNPSLVTYNVKSPAFNSEITVQTNQEGNALVGAYNKEGEIIWSWHIWVTNNEPDNRGNAVVYTTYRWDAGGIYPNERVPGYGIMPCNLGALDSRSPNDMLDYCKRQGYKENNDDMKVLGYSVKKGDRFPESQVRTFGMLYQWGRKDPFPPITHSTGTEDRNGDASYDNAHTDLHYASDNNTVVDKTSNKDPRGDYLFFSHTLDPGQSAGILRPARPREEAIPYSIKNPTVYIIGTSGSGYTNDWCGQDANPKLWGATDDYSVSYEVIDDYYIHKNYGEKSIFDPCPTGWRVPPGDLWLGFTKTGLNPSQDDTEFEQVNYNDEESGYRPGLSMFVRAWRGGPTTYFPMQGMRRGTGDCVNPGLCGNYHNATCDKNGKVNILHLHRNMNVVSKWDGTGGATGNMLFRIFETSEANLAKSTASPVRCVRDSR